MALKEWVIQFITLGVGVVTPFITGRGPSCRTTVAFCWRKEGWMFLLLTSVLQDIRKAEASSSSGCVHKPCSENIGIFGGFLIMKVLGGVAKWEGINFWEHMLLVAAVTFLNVSTMFAPTRSNCINQYDLIVMWMIFVSGFVVHDIGWFFLLVDSFQFAIHHGW